MHSFIYYFSKFVANSPNAKRELLYKKQLKKTRELITWKWKMYKLYLYSLESRENQKAGLLRVLVHQS